MFHPRVRGPAGKQYAAAAQSCNRTHLTEQQLNASSSPNVKANIISSPPRLQNHQEHLKASVFAV